MRVFYDTEFIEDGRTIDLVSIGMVKETGETYYAVSSEFDASKADDWVVKNVLSKLRVPLYSGERIPRDTIKRGILDFVGDDIPEFWAYYADYDHVALCQLFGRMIDLPTGWPMYTNDLKQLAGDYHLPKMEETKAHSALSDAKWVMNAYQELCAE